MLVWAAWLACLSGLPGWHAYLGCLSSTSSGVQVRSWGYEPLLLSCEEGFGLDAVAQLLRGKVAVVAGPSGEGRG